MDRPGPYSKAYAVLFYQLKLASPLSHLLLMSEQMAWLMSASASLAEHDANPKAACLSHADLALESCSTVGQGQFPSEQSHMFYLLQVLRKRLHLVCQLVKRSQVFQSCKAVTHQMQACNSSPQLQV